MDTMNQGGNTVKAFDLAALAADTSAPYAPDPTPAEEAMAMVDGGATEATDSVSVNPVDVSEDLLEVYNNGETPNLMNVVEANTILDILGECQLEILMEDDTSTGEVYIGKSNDNTAIQQVKLVDIVDICITYLKAAKESIPFPVNEAGCADMVNLDQQLCIMERLRERAA